MCVKHVAFSIGEPKRSPSVHARGPPPIDPANYATVYVYEAGRCNRCNRRTRRHSRHSSRSHWPRGVARVHTHVHTIPLTSSHSFGASSARAAHRELRIARTHTPSSSSSRRQTGSQARSAIGEMRAVTPLSLRHTGGDAPPAAASYFCTQ